MQAMTPTFDKDTVVLQITGGVGVVTLNNPDKRNRLDAPTNAALIEAFDFLEGDKSVGAVVITGAGRAFCAGADLGDLAEKPNERDLRSIYEGFLRISSCSLPTIAAVQGPAVGAGINVALACDLRIGSSSARFETRFVDLGLHAGGGYTWMLQNAVGLQATNAMALFGQGLSATAALSLGLLWEVVDDQTDLLERAIELATRAAAGPRELNQRLKQTIKTMASVSSHAQAVDTEVGPQLWSLQQPFFAERVAAFQARIQGK